jgi:hypothetical protein
MIDFNTTLGHHLFELPIADRIGYIPSDGPEDDIAFELAALEIDHGCRTDGLFPVSLLAPGKANFATEPPAGSQGLATVGSLHATRKQHRRTSPAVTSAMPYD